MDGQLTQDDFNELILEALTITCEKDEVRRLGKLLRDFFGKELKDIVMQANNDQSYTIESPELRSAVSRRLAFTCAINNAVDCLTLLLQRLPGVFDLNQPDEEGTPCIHHAVLSQHVEAVAALLQHGALVDGRDSKRRAPLHLAVAYQQREIVLLLLAKKAALDSQDAVGATPLHYAVQMCCSDIADRDASVAILLCLLRAKAPTDFKDNRGRTPLHWAAAGGNCEVCRLLCSYSATADLKDSAGQTAIHLAAKTAHADVVYTLARECNADVNLRDGSKQTALLVAAAAGQADSVKALLELGAKDLADNSGNNAAHVTASAGRLKILEMLQAAGHTLWSTNLRGELPIHLAIAAKKNDVVFYLLQNSKNSNPRSSAMRSCIHVAAGSGNVEVLLRLLQLGVSVNAAMKYPDGYMLPLDVAEQKSQSAAADALRERDGQRASVVVPRSAQVVQRTMRRVAHLLRENRKCSVKTTYDVDHDEGSETDIRPFLELLHRRLQTMRVAQSHQAQRKIFEQLMLHETHSNPRGLALRSCFHMAAATGNVDLASSLVLASVSVNCTMEYGGIYKTPLDVAEERSQAECALWLRQNGGEKGESVVARCAIVLQRAVRRALLRRGQRQLHERGGELKDEDADDSYDGGALSVKHYLSLLYRRVDRRRTEPPLK